MTRYRLLVAVFMIALIVPVLGCGTRNRCCAPKPTSPCCPTPGAMPGPPPPPVGAGF